MKDIAFESHGVRIRVSSDRPDVAERIGDLLPPDSKPCAIESADESFGLVSDGDGAYVFTRGDSPVAKNIDLEFGLMMIETQIRIYLGQEAPNRIFVHAGVVAAGNRAIVLPGRSFAGKTTLVAAFVRAGATYFSDEFAVLDEHGLVHPYLTRLSIREGAEALRAPGPAGPRPGSSEVRTHVHVSQLGGVSGDTALPVGAIVVTNYRPGAAWEPRELSPGRAALALLYNTVAALTRHEEALTVLSRATSGALLLEGERGEPEPVVEEVLSRLSNPGVVSGA
jgi:hypothetical protein